MCTFSAPDHISIFLVSQFQSCLPISSPVFSRLYKHLEETCWQLPIAANCEICSWWLILRIAAILCGWKNSSITPDLLGSSKLSLDSNQQPLLWLCGPNPSLQTEWQVGFFWYLSSIQAPHTLMLFPVSLFRIALFPTEKLAPSWTIFVQTWVPVKLLCWTFVSEIACKAMNDQKSENQMNQLD